MFIYLDESGDLGFNFKKESSSHFVITLLVCENSSTVFSFKTAVKHTVNRKLMKSTKTNVPKELKSTQSLLNVKKYFLDNLRKQANQAWSIYGIILNKKELLEKITAKPEKHRLYNLLSKIILQTVDFSNNHKNKSVQLIVDKSKGKKERVIFNQYIKTNIENILDIGIQFRINHEKSHNSAGLQAVDLFCAGFSRKYSYNDTCWYDLFKDKIRKEILFDGNQHK